MDSRGLFIDGTTVAEAYQRRVKTHGQHRVHMVKQSGKYQVVNWSQLHEKVLGVAQFLLEQGLQAEDKVCILSQTSPEWNIADLAILNLGMVTVPIYPSNTAAELQYIFENSEAKLIFVDCEKQLDKVRTAFQGMGSSFPVVCFFDEIPTVADLEVHAYTSACRLDKRERTEKIVAERAGKVSKEDVASIIYTSGTTGQPKGVVLTHNNFASGIRAIGREVSMTPEDMMLTFLPFAHVLGRVESIAPVFCGITLGFAEDVSTISQNLLELRPTLMISVPRIYEKVYDKIISSVESQSEVKKKLFYWAVEVGRDVARHRSRKQALSPILNIKFQVADRLVLSKIREKLGGRIRLTASGGAPISPELCQFFHGCGVKVLEGYGLTETLGPVIVNRPDNYRFGTVGLPIGDVQLKIAEDGEILMKGSPIMKGYYRNPEATEQTFTQDGWLCTGDIGEITDEGFLKITDRKKELIVTSGGKNIAPQKLENLVKLNRFVSNCMVFGDQKKYVTALITLNETEITAWATDQNISSNSYKELTKKSEIVKLVEEAMQDANKHLASFETMKKFRILPSDFSVETGELTPSLKLKRKVVVQKYECYINSMY